MQITCHVCISHDKCIGMTSAKMNFRWVPFYVADYLWHAVHATQQ